MCPVYVCVRGCLGVLLVYVCVCVPVVGRYVCKLCTCAAHQDTSLKFSTQVTYLDAIVILTIYASWIDLYGRRTCIVMLQNVNKTFEACLHFF